MISQVIGAAACLRFEPRFQANDLIDALSRIFGLSDRVNIAVNLARRTKFAGLIQICLGNKTLKSFGQTLICD